VILAFVHFGPISVLRYWLRSCGKEAATLAVRPQGGRSIYRGYLDQLSDAASGLAGVPHLFDVGQLKQLYHFLQPHRILMIAVDGYQGRPVEVLDGDLSFRMVPGAVRLAAKVNAVVVPCLISGDRPLGVTIHFGTPAPAAAVADKAAQAAACAHLLREFLPVLRAQPEQFTFELMAHFRAQEAPPGPTVDQTSGVLS
jgi:lauroyl/myristoyl acyltransferase